MEHIVGGQRAPNPSAGAKMRGAEVTWNSSIE